MSFSGTGRQLAFMSRAALGEFESHVILLLGSNSSAIKSLAVWRAPTALNTVGHDVLLSYVPRVTQLYIEPCRCRPKLSVFGTSPDSKRQHRDGWTFRDASAPEEHHRECQKNLDGQKHARWLRGAKQEILNTVETLVPNNEDLCYYEAFPYS